MDVILLIGFGLVIAAIVAVPWFFEPTFRNDGTSPYNRGLAEGRKQIPLDRRYLASLDRDGQQDYLLGRRIGWNERVVEVLDNRRAAGRNNSL
jgi:hypothetical protein